jgi:hypothetical protein
MSKHVPRVHLLNTFVDSLLKQSERRLQTPQPDHDREVVSDVDRIP